jgi:hypothetical protein
MKKVALNTIIAGALLVSAGCVAINRGEITGLYPDELLITRTTTGGQVDGIASPGGQFETRHTGSYRVEGSGESGVLSKASTDKQAVLDVSRGGAELFGRLVTASTTFPDGLTTPGVYVAVGSVFFQKPVRGMVSIMGQQSAYLLPDNESKSVLAVHAGAPTSRFHISGIMPLSDDISGSCSIEPYSSSCVKVTLQYAEDSFACRGRSVTMPWGDGTVVRFKGTNQVWGISFVGDQSDPLVFALISDVGFVYLHGNGRVTEASGNIVDLPRKGVDD